MIRINSWIGVLIIIAIASFPTFIAFNRDGLVKSQAAQNVCLSANSLGKQVCATCISRADLEIFRSSNIIIQSPSEFKAMQIEKGNLLECKEILHLISYEIPISQVSQIEIEVLNKVKELRKLVGISINPYEQNLAEISPKIEQIAIFNVRSEGEQASIDIKYSPRETVKIVDTFLQILSGIVILYSLFSTTLNIFQEGELQTTSLAALCISTMVLTSLSVPAV